MVFSSVYVVYLSSCSSWPPSLASRSARSFPWIPQCAGIHCRVRFDWAARSTRAVSTSLRSFWGGGGGGFWSLLRTERASVKLTTLGLVRGRLFRISIAALLRASASVLKLVEYFPVAMVICAIPPLYLTCTPPPPSRVACTAEPSV